jgi:hypothetical protein
LIRHLFVERFLTPFSDGGPEPAASYDESRSLNVTSGGRPVVELLADGATGTITEVRTEAADRDEPEDAAVPTMGTVTKVRRESSDRLPEVATQTRVRREHGDQLEAGPGMSKGRPSIPVSRLGTKTGVRGEAADFSCELDLREEAPAPAPARVVSTG